jgi:hypothetical protein
MLVLKKTEGKLISLSEVRSSAMNAKSWFTRDFIDNLQELVNNRDLSVLFNDTISC